MAAYKGVTEKVTEAWHATEGTKHDFCCIHVLDNVLDNDTMIHIREIRFILLV